VGKKIEYKGKGTWKIMVIMPEPLAVEAHKILMRRGSTCADMVRCAIADYVDRNRQVSPGP